MLELLELKRGKWWISVNSYDDNDDNNDDNNHDNDDDDDDYDDGEMLFVRRPGNPVLVSIVYSHGTRTCIKRKKITYGNFLDFRAQKFKNVYN